MSKLELKIPPPPLMATTAGLMWLTSRAVPTLAMVLPYQRTLTLGVAAIAVLVSVLGVTAIRRAHTTINPTKPENTSVLVTTGIYRVTRNPMYLGLLLVLAAWFLYLANLAALVFLPLFVLYLNRFQIVPEERVLTAKFGRGFTAYCTRVRRW